MIERIHQAAIEKYGHGNGQAILLGSQTMPDGCPAHRYLHGLGYAPTIALDTNGEGDRVVDLNDGVPADLHNTAMLVYDGGVCEHVANVGAALMGIVQMTRVGGVVVMANPVNCYGESYYNFDPQLLDDFFRKNGFKTMETCLYYTRSWRRRLEGRIMQHAPKFARYLRRQLHKMVSVRDWVYADTRKRTLSPWGHFAALPQRTHLLYVAERLWIPAKLRWPIQRVYRSPHCY